MSGLEHMKTLAMIHGLGLGIVPSRVGVKVEGKFVTSFVGPVGGEAFLSIAGLLTVVGFCTGIFAYLELEKDPTKMPYSGQASIVFSFS